MTLGAVIKKIFKLIEEYDSTGNLYTSDQDLETKIREFYGIAKKNKQ